MNAVAQIHTRIKRSRRGSVLLVVLVVIMLLALGAYSFAELMLAEASAVEAAARGVQVRNSAQSGVEYAAAVLQERLALGEENLYHNPALFFGQAIVSADDPTPPARFSFVAPVESDPTARQVRYGLMDESGKINLMALVARDLDDEAMRAVLMPLPGMTEDIADAILDFVDSDTELRPFGAEDEYYTTLSPPYPTKNGPLESLDELLLVRGVTPWMLFGEDANRNGLLDPNENDGEASPPFDDGDGLLLPGWNQFLTVHGREANRRADGTPRINLNESLLTDLYDQLIEEFTEDEARFIIAYRMNGPVDADGTDDDAGDASAKNEREAIQKLAQAFASGVANGNGGAVTRGGMDLSKGGSTRIKSLYDLVGVQVEAQIDGAKSTLDSPWSGEGSDLQQVMPDLLDKLSTTDTPYIEGRININQARGEVLAGIPEMPEELITAILGNQMMGSSGEPLDDAISGRATTAWLVAQGLTDLPTLRKLDPYITTRGDVYRVQVVGHLDGGGPVCRMEAMIDGTQLPPRVVFLRDLTDMGRGFTRAQLQIAP